MNPAILVAASSLPLLALAQVPTSLGYQGRLLKADGTPEAGALDITFAVYSAASGGDALWNETQKVGLTDGFYSVFLGSQTSMPATLWNGPDRWLEISVSSHVLAPRQRVASVAYALRAGSATVATGTSLTGSGTPDAPLEVAFAGTGSAKTASRSDHSHRVRSVYAVWGRTTCGDDPMVHIGFAGGFGASQGAMGGEAMCLDSQMELSSWTGWGGALVSRARSSNQASGNRSEYMSSGDLTCAVCKGTSYTLWGRITCGDGDTAIYAGYIGHFNYASENGGHANAGPFCIDEAAPVKWTNWGGNSIIARAAGANGTNYSQYLDGRDARCVVCR